MSTVDPPGPGHVPPPPPPPPWPSQQPAPSGKPKKKWYKRKLVIAAAVILIIAIGASAGSKKKDTAAAPTTTAAPTTAPGPASTNAPGTTAAPATTTAKRVEPKRLYPGRVDSQKDDQERALGGEVRLSGYTAVAKTASFQQSLSDFESDGYVVADVTVLNRDSSAQAYNLLDWRLQTPGGQVLDPDFATTTGQLESGDLVKNGTVSGKVIFKVGATKGQYFLIYKPDPFDAARGIWGVSI